VSARSYPYKAWILQPSFKPIEVTFVEPYRWLNEHRADVSDAGKYVLLKAIHPTLEAAIAHGWSEVERIQADIDKRNENLRKKRAALNKAAGHLGDAS
jgi:predicted nucleotide-binding protein (sugar kinase/HSP70/actin superfamily)